MIITRLFIYSSSYVLRRSSGSFRCPPFLFVSLRARRQVLQRLLGLRVVVACRGLDDALLPSAVVSGGELVPPIADLNACCPGALMVPSLELGAICCPRQLTIAFPLNVLRKDDDFSSILHTVLECEIDKIAATVSRMQGTCGARTVQREEYQLNPFAATRFSFLA